MRLPQCENYPATGVVDRRMAPLQHAVSVRVNAAIFLGQWRSNWSDRGEHSRHNGLVQRDKRGFYVRRNCVRRNCTLALRAWRRRRPPPGGWLLVVRRGTKRCRRLSRAAGKGAGDRVRLAGDHAQQGAHRSARNATPAFVLPDRIDREAEARREDLL